MFVLLILRGLAGLAFGVYLAKSSGLSWEDYFGVFASYLIVDGLLAAGVAATLLRESVGKQRGRELGLGVVVLVDGLGRMLSGGAIYVWPGVAGFPLTGMMLVALMAACTTTVGVVEAWLAAREEVARHGAGHQAPQFMVGPVGLASLLSTAFGVAGVFYLGSPETMRLLISGFVVAAGVVALAMAWSRRRMSTAALASP